MSKWKDSKQKQTCAQRLKQINLCKYQNTIHQTKSNQAITPLRSFTASSSTIVTKHFKTRVGTVITPRMQIRDLIKSIPLIKMIHLDKETTDQVCLRCSRRRTTMMCQDLVGPTLALRDKTFSMEVGQRCILPPNGTSNALGNRTMRFRTQR